jgi:ketosteroid isomerase-like protein
MSPRSFRLFVLLAANALAAGVGRAQTPLPPAQTQVLPTPTVPALPSASPTVPFKLIPFDRLPELSPGILKLLDLEGRFADSVVKGGSAAFATWLADDVVILNNGQPPIIGRTAFTAKVNWDPRVYKLNWVADGAQMSAAQDMGFTWGQYEGTTTLPDGKIDIKRGRYMTIWKKLPDGSWKVAMDASAEAAPNAGLGLPPTP